MSIFLDGVVEKVMMSVTNLLACNTYICTTGSFCKQIMFGLIIRLVFLLCLNMLFCMTLNVYVYVLDFDDTLYE